MRKLVMFTILTLSSLSFAYSEKDCERNDFVKVELTVSPEYIEPRVIYLQEGDKVCLFLKAVDTNVSINVDKLPISIYANPRKTGFEFFRATKVGEFALKCRGCGYKSSNPRIIIQSREEFQKYEEEKYREDSSKFRKKLKTNQKEDKYKSNLDDYSGYRERYRDN